MKAILLFVLFLGLTLQNDELAEIDATNFGHSLIDTVELQLKANEGVDDLMTVLDKMRDTMDLNKE